MLYLNEKNLKIMGVDWSETIEVIKKAVITMADNDFSQPIKPYLRFGDSKNRIIAMPAFLGGECNKAGIKWIASFPDNIKKDIPRANSVTILNNAYTGEVEAIINTAHLSVVRTASVTGLIIQKYLEMRKTDHLNVGIIGLGPIGKNHFSMCCNILKDKVDNYYLYDKRPIIQKDKMQAHCSQNIIISPRWEEVYENADIFMCCTASDTPYIDLKPKKGALILNISLRDFKEETYHFFKDSIIVDDWKEVCRENTIIDTWSRKYGMAENNTYSIVDVVNNNAIIKLADTNNIMFNPMGMAVFDIAMANYYYVKALAGKVGIFID